MDWSSLNPRFVGIAAVILITAQIAIGVHLYHQQQRIQPQQGKTFTGKTIDIINPKEGHLTLVSFWASTCLPCIKEMPDFIDLHKTYQDKSFSIVGITMPYDQYDLSLAVIKHFQISWHNVLDSKGKLITGFGDIKVVPTTLLLDHEGGILWKQEGPVDFRQLRQHINQNLASGPENPI